MTTWMCCECGYVVLSSPNGRRENVPPFKCPVCSQLCFTDVTCYAPGRGSGVGSIDMKLVGSLSNAKRMRKTL